jgi:LysM repeat protein
VAQIRNLVHRSTKLSKRAIRYTLIGINVGILGAVLLFFLNYTQGGTTSSFVGLSSVTNPNASTSDPLDQLSAADIAVEVAQMVNIPEVTAVQNQAETVNAQLAITPAENLVIAKPQVVATALKTRQDIQEYTVQPGDTLASIAAKFNITTNSVLWSNNLKSTNLLVGSKIIVPPISGVVYTVKSGDTAQSLAQTYSANADQITAFNDAEISGLIVGEQIVIPDGQQPVSHSAGYGIYGGLASYGPNGYDYGYCTWYVASQIAVPNNWGNASSWAYYAALDGWTVSSTPTVGAIAQTPYAAGGQGHVAIVTAVSVSALGVTMIQYKDMNNYGDGGGFGRVGYSGWTVSTLFPNYITH